MSYRRGGPAERAAASRRPPPGWSAEQEAEAEAARVAAEVEELRARLDALRGDPRPKAATRPPAARAQAAREQAVGGVELPPRANSTGRRYYAFTAAEPPWVACGSSVALAALGGSWPGRGLSPCGFATLEEALLHVNRVCDVVSCEVQWR